MAKSTYLKIVGIIELASSIIGIIFGFIVMIAASIGSAWATSLLPSSSFNGIATGVLMLILWLIYLIFAFLSPAVGVLFLTVADILEVETSTNNHVYSVANPFSSSGRIQELEKKIKKLNQKIEAIEAKQPDEGVDEEEQPANALDETPVEKADKANNAPLVTKKNINEYKTGDRIAINDNIVINGIPVAKGTTGIIDNRITSLYGQKYVVILDDTNETIEVAGDNFE